MTRVALPAGVVPAGQLVAVTVEVENAGRVPSAASELRLCLLEHGSGCDRPIDVIPLPDLQSGERITLRRPVQLPPSLYPEFAVAADIDPDGITAEVRRTNNRATSARIATELPELQWLSLSAGPRVGDGTPVPVRLKVRYRSSVAASPATEIQFSGAGAGCTGWGDDDLHSIPVPALAPRQTYEITIAITDAAGRGCQGEAFINAVLNPRRKGHWADGEWDEPVSAKYLIVR